jgi:hypothetical protein
MAAELPEITEIRRVRIEPGDSVVVRTQARIDMATAARIKELASAALGIDAGRVLVLSEGTAIEVVST